MMKKTIVGRLQAVSLNHDIEKSCGVTDPIFEIAPTTNTLRPCALAGELARLFIGNLLSNYQAIEEGAVVL
jgi:hypothetical protein